MIVATAQITLYIPWAHSLKDKRMVVKSLVTKVRDKFNVSIAEVDGQDLHQTAVLGLACVSQSNAQADSALDHVICFVENRTDAEITRIEREIR